MSSIAEPHQRRADLRHLVAEARIVDDDSSDEEPLKIVKKRKTFN